MRIIRCSLAWLYVMLLRLANSQLPQAESCVAPSAIELPIEVDGQHDTVRLRPDEPLTHTAHHFCAERHAMRFASALAKSQCTDVVLRYLKRRRSELLWCGTEDGGRMAAADTQSKSMCSSKHPSAAAATCASRLEPPLHTPRCGRCTQPSSSGTHAGDGPRARCRAHSSLEALVSLSVLDLPPDDEQLRMPWARRWMICWGPSDECRALGEAVRRLRPDADAELVDRLVMAMLSAGKLRHRSRCALRSAIHRYKSLRFPDGDACLLSLLPKAHECPKTQHVHSQPPFSPNPLPSPWPQRESRCRQDALAMRAVSVLHTSLCSGFASKVTTKGGKVAAALEQKQRDVSDALRLNAALRHGVCWQPLHILKTRQMLLRCANACLKFLMHPLLKTHCDRRAPHFCAPVMPTIRSPRILRGCKCRYLFRLDVAYAHFFAMTWQAVMQSDAGTA